MSSLPSAPLPSGPLAHTPWDGSHPLFRTGLEPLGDETWIEVDGKLDDYLAEKERLLRDSHSNVFAAETESQEAQIETLELLKAHLLARHQNTHRLDGRQLFAGTHEVDLDDASMPPLEKAARLVQEDLVIMMRGDDGWILAAGCVCFPSSWSLAEKFAKPLHQVHAPVPGFGPGTRNAGLIDRIFDNLKPETPVRRMNWSVYPDAELFHGSADAEARSSPLHRPYLRVERQTLRRLPLSGAILFTIRIHLDPLDLLGSHPERKRLARGFIDSLVLLDEGQCRYKGLENKRGELIKRLEAIAQTPEDCSGRNSERQA